MYYSGGNWHKPQNSHAALLDKYWTKLQMGNITQSELKKVSVSVKVADVTFSIEPFQTSTIRDVPWLFPA